MKVSKINKKSKDVFRPNYWLYNSFSFLYKLVQIDFMFAEAEKNKCVNCVNCNQTDHLEQKTTQFQKKKKKKKKKKNGDDQKEYKQYKVHREYQ